LNEITNELNETRDNNDDLLTQLKELSEAQGSKSSSSPKELALVEEVNALKEANKKLEGENSGLRRQLLAAVSTSAEFAEIIRKQIQALKAENDKNLDQSRTIDLTEVEEVRLFPYKGGTEVHQDLPSSDVPELLRRYNKLGKRFAAVTEVSEHLNQLVDNAHQRNQELESEISTLRSENLSLLERLRRKNQSNQTFIQETERVLAKQAQVLDHLGDS
jgi:DNA repair exonuclease SbcCD ATPase subunit